MGIIKEKIRILTKIGKASTYMIKNICKLKFNRKGLLKWVMKEFILIILTMKLIYK